MNPIKEPIKRYRYHLVLDWEVAKWLGEFSQKRRMSLNKTIGYILELYKKSKERQQEQKNA